MTPRASEIAECVRKSLEKYFKDLDGERPLIRTVLRQTRWNQVRTAQVLGINRNTLRTKMQALGIRRGGDAAE